MKVDIGERFKENRKKGRVIKTYLQILSEIENDLTKLKRMLEKSSIEEQELIYKAMAVIENKRFIDLEVFLKMLADNNNVPVKYYAEIRTMLGL